MTQSSPTAAPKPSGLRSSTSPRLTEREHGDAVVIRRVGRAEGQVVAQRAGQGRGRPARRSRSGRAAPRGRCRGCRRRRGGRRRRSGRRTARRARGIVLLPAPLGPTRATRDPGARRRETPCSTSPCSDACSSANASLADRRRDRLLPLGLVGGFRIPVIAPRRKRIAAFVTTGATGSSAASPSASLGISMIS